MIATILLLPNADTRERLLAPGAPVWVGADPLDPSPDAEFGWAVGRDVPQSDGLGESDHMDCVPVAWASIGVGHADPTRLHLVLARDGAIVPEGVDRLCHVDPGYRPWDPSALTNYLRALLSGEKTYRHGDRGQCGTLFGDLGTLILLDSSGSEVSP